MKIGFVTGEFPPMQGGVGAFTQELARAMGADGHVIHIITSRKAKPEGMLRSLSTRREPEDLRFAWLHPWIGRWRWPSLAQVVDVAIRFELDILNIQYQAAAYNMNSAAINFLPWRIKGVLPTVVTFHDLRTPYLFPKAGPLREKAVFSMARWAYGAITTNRADFDRLRQKALTPVAEIPIGSNIKTYTPNHIEIAEVRDKLKLAAHDLLLGYFGFLNASKGADTLLQALAQLDGRFHLVFIGGQTGASDNTNADFLAQTRQLVDNLGLADRVHWSGYLADERVSTYLQAADIMVMPYRDGVSLRRGTLMAALAHGRPLISTIPAEPIPQLAHGENIWLVVPDDAAALTQAVKALAADPDLRGRLGQGAEKLAGLFSWDKIADQTIEFYQKILNSDQGEKA